ncbi:MAG: hypothetical protein WC307_03215 [Candidatus Nanoarchaeia archaeon]|jgi:DNA primase catalytic subunit
MRTSELIKYYSQQGFINFMLKFSRGREVVPRFGNYFGERPQSFRFEGELLDVIRRGASSFHCSEEHWTNPMALSADMNRKELDSLRSGWDLIFDVDCPIIDYSRLCAKLIIDALEILDIKEVSIKFSGGTGFHIGLSFSNPERIKGELVKNLFPDALRVIGSYIQWVIKDFLKDELLRTGSINNIAVKMGVETSALLVNNEFDPFKVVNIDPIAISSRHLIRAPYSINEKKWLVSKPIKPSEVLDFNPESARPENITFELGFLEQTCDASRLFREAFDWHDKIQSEKKPVSMINKTVPKTAVNTNCFPPCINNILTGLTDGRKRALFMLINFYYKCGYDWELIEALLIKWNETNKSPLRTGYIKAQIDWSCKQGGLMPPNCKSPNYKDIGVCAPDGLCAKINNPVTYALHKHKMTKTKRRSSTTNQPQRRKKKQGVTKKPAGLTKENK